MSDSATWVAVGLAIGAASLAPVAALVVVRGRRSSDAAVDQLLKDSLQRTEGLHGDLAAALEEARTETRRARELGEIGATIDLDAVLTLTLEAAGAFTGVDVNLIRLPGSDEGEALLATLGLSTDEAARQPVAGPPGGQLRQDDDGTSLFERADEALYRRRKPARVSSWPPTVSASRLAGGASPRKAA
jgi:hypothetical protein